MRNYRNSHADPCEVWLVNAPLSIYEKLTMLLLAAWGGHILRIMGKGQSIGAGAESALAMYPPSIYGSK